MRDNRPALALERVFAMLFVVASFLILELSGDGNSLRDFDWFISHLLITFLLMLVVVTLMLSRVLVVMALVLSGLLVVVTLMSGRMLVVVLIVSVFMMVFVVVIVVLRVVCLNFLVFMVVLVSLLFVFVVVVVLDNSMGRINLTLLNVRHPQ